jgi:nucleoside-diphosphate-sugar epimerase
MSVFILGANGFVGRSVAEELRSSYETILVSNTPGADFIQLDATDFDSTVSVLKETKPEYIVNCAGIVQNTEAAAANVDITMNLLKSVVAANITVKRFIILGSAAEYGIVEPSSSGTSEVDEVKPFSVYGKYKAQETKEALEFGRNNSIDVVVARLFNPIGKNMNDRFLIPALLRQIEEIKTGNRSDVEISRADSLRDYIDVRDVARAIGALLSAERLEYNLYNIGSGKEISNQVLISTLFESLGMQSKPSIVETQTEPEDTIASKADISRIIEDTNWKPEYTLQDTIREIIKDAKR